MTKPSIDKHISWKPFEWLLLLLLLGLALWPVWANPIFLTNDGPTHLYNSRILRDLFLGQDNSFYQAWYHLNPNIEPNWLSHFLLAIFQLFLPALLAEKIFITLCIAGFLFAFRYLAKSLHVENGAFAFLIVPFIFHKVFLIGFYNYAASVVLFFLVAGFWLRYQNQLTVKKLVLLGSLLLLLALTHPVSYSFALGLMGIHWLAGTYETVRNSGWPALIREAGRLTLAALPSMGLIIWFLVRKGTSTTPGETPFHKLFHDLLELKSLVLFSDLESPFLMLLAILIGALVILGLVRLFTQPSGSNSFRNTSILLMMALCLFAYFNQPATVAGIGIVPERLQFYPFLFALTWLITLAWPNWLRKGVVFTGFILAAILLSIRLPYYHDISDAAEEYLSVQSHMRPYTTVMPVNYSPEGRYPYGGDQISEKIWLFVHTADYLGAQQPHIMLSNYEANTNWFPLRYQADRNPYLLLGEGVGLEGWPPAANISGFEQKTGQTVDYVILWCLSEGLRKFPEVQAILQQLDAGYEEIFVSENERARLFARKPVH